MNELSQTLYSQMQQAQVLDKAIRQNLVMLGYKEKRDGDKPDGD
jgi:type I restriction enzyme M protein